jgi:hypothetical protein
MDEGRMWRTLARWAACLVVGVVLRQIVDLVRQ